jgi:hypothetical protein
MTADERSAIQNAIVKGIETALQRVLVKPFPEGDPASALFHARGDIEAAVAAELDAIIPTP